VVQGSLLERYLRTIDLCNDSQLIKDEQGCGKSPGEPRALKVLAAKIQLPPLDTEMRSKSRLIRSINTCPRFTVWAMKR
jgi:hypothetical protein